MSACIANCNLLCNSKTIFILFQFKGKGVLVDYLNNILAHNKTVEVDKVGLLESLSSLFMQSFQSEMFQSIDSNECLTKPTRPGVELAICWLFIPLLLSVLLQVREFFALTSSSSFLQVVFSFIIRRIIFNYYMPFMYPRRARVRLIHLYNKVRLNSSKYRVNEYTLMLREGANEVKF